MVKRVSKNCHPERSEGSHTLNYFCHNEFASRFAVLRYPQNGELVKICFNLFFIFLFAVFSFSCNYSFKGASPPAGIKTIYIPTFRDASGFGLPRLSEDMTQLLKQKFINDNTLEYAEKTTADGMLDCIITSVLDEPLVVSGGEQVSKRKITINVSVDFSNLKKQKSIWKRDFSNWGEYDSSSGGFSKRDEGIKITIDKITDDILLEVISNW